jgi:hypothetical protein
VATGTLLLQDAKDGVDVSRHFSYYAWEGGAGSLRWKHEVLQSPYNLKDFVRWPQIQAAGVARPRALQKSTKISH